MVTNEYRFLTLWTVEGGIEEAAEVLEDVEGLTAWWPAVYLSLLVENPGGQGGIGKRVKLLTRGWLPYLLHWTLVVHESDSPHRFVIDAEGDFVGRGTWNLKQVGPKVEITYDWHIYADKPLLKLLGFALRPLFEANHRWAMATGEKSLQLEMQRRRALREGLLVRSKRPPGPALYSGPLLIGLGVVAVLGLVAARRRKAMAPDEVDELDG